MVILHLPEHTCCYFYSATVDVVIMQENIWLIMSLGKLMIWAIIGLVSRNRDCNPSVLLPVFPTQWINMQNTQKLIQDLQVSAACSCKTPAAKQGFAFIIGTWVEQVKHSRLKYQEDLFSTSSDLTVSSWHLRCRFLKAIQMDMESLITTLQCLCPWNVSERWKDFAKVNDYKMSPTSVTCLCNSPLM